VKITGRGKKLSFFSSPKSYFATPQVFTNVKEPFLDGRTESVLRAVQLIVTGKNGNFDSEPPRI
jgi:hypothetical protein